MIENTPQEHLLIAGDTGDTTVFALSRPVTHVGRGLNADVHLDDHTVSRRHALLVRTRDGTRLIDDRSANGTCVNGEAVSDVVLADGDVLTLGATTLTYCRADGPDEPATSGRLSRVA